jgi:ERCC4-type nuclease
VGVKRRQWGQERRTVNRLKGKPRIVAVKVQTPDILVDNREGSKELVNYSPLDECGLLCRLESGDACFSGNGPRGDLAVGVEVKSVLDLISSMNTGRLQATQVPAMLEQYDVTWLLVYRRFTVGKSGELLIATGSEWRPQYLGSKPMPYGYLEGHLTTLTMAGVHVKCVSDVAEAAWWLGVLARWYAKPWKNHKSLQTFDRSRSVSPQPMDKEMRDPITLMIAEMASHLPTVGYKRAVAVAKHFGSVVDMVNATEEQWAEVEGVGKVVAREAVLAMRKIKECKKGRGAR